MNFDSHELEIIDTESAIAIKLTYCGNEYINIEQSQYDDEQGKDIVTIISIPRYGLEKFIEIIKGNSI